MTAKPLKVSYMGEPIADEDVPGTGAVDNEDYFKTPRISPRAIDDVSKSVPPEHWVDDGLHTWTLKRAAHVFKHMTTGDKSGRYRTLLYEFGYDAEGPVLVRVRLYDLAMTMK